jgi:hypothetical protein
VSRFEHFRDQPGCVLRQRHNSSIGASMRAKTQNVIFYTKSGCRLCDDALDLLLTVSGEEDCSLAIRKIDILEDETLYARLRHRVPVIQFDPDNGGPTLYAPFTATDLRQALFADRDRGNVT